MKRTLIDPVKCEEDTLYIFSVYRYDAGIGINIAILSDCYFYFNNDFFVFQSFRCYASDIEEADYGLRTSLFSLFRVPSSTMLKEMRAKLLSVKFKQIMLLYRR